MSATKAKVQAFQYNTLEQLNSEPIETHEWLCKGLALRLGGSSITGAMPKTGKSAFLRQLCYSVATGKPFLGFEVMQGKVLYLGLEDHRNQVKSHFAALGAANHPDILVALAQDMSSHLERLTLTIKALPDVVLIAIDPLAKFFGNEIENINEYSKVNPAIATIHNLSRINPNLHIAMSHHNSKRKSETVASNFLGSQSLGGGCDSNIMLEKDSRGIRYLTTDCRDGEFNIEKTALGWNSESKSLSLGQKNEEIQAEQRESTDERVKSLIIGFVVKNPNATRQLLQDSITAEATTFAKCLKELVETGCVIRTGTGRKGDPFLYSVAAMETISLSGVAA
jgi:hypothetical protein